jgi:hypothetical protein
VGGRDANVLDRDDARVHPDLQARVGKLVAFLLPALDSRDQLELAERL